MQQNTRSTIPFMACLFNSWNLILAKGPLKPDSLPILEQFDCGVSSIFGNCAMGLDKYMLTQYISTTIYEWSLDIKINAVFVISAILASY